MIATAFVAIFSHSTSPLYCDHYDYPDSDIFQIIGKYWSEGHIPYIELWDMKGPYIFLLNAMGYYLTGTRFGVFLIQIVFLCATLWFTYLTFRTHSSVRISAIATLASLLPLSYTYQGGNLTEEYLLPFFALSFLLILRWGTDVQRRHVTNHPPIYSILYGATLGLSLMSRLTNSLPVCAAVIVISIFLLRHKLYRNLWFNACTFIIGFLCTTLPFILYFHSHHALTEMWNATFIYPFEYAQKSTRGFSNTGIHNFILNYWNSIILLAIAVWGVIRYRKTDIKFWLWFMSALLPFLWFCQGNHFGHYGMTVFPLFAISMIELSRLHLKRLSTAVILVMTVACATKIRYSYIIHNAHSPKEHLYSDFLQSCKEIDYSSFAAYDCAPLLYLALDIHPAIPYFSLQEMAFERQMTLSDNITNSFRSLKAEWILVDYEWTKDIAIQQILNQYYSAVMVSDDNHLVLYRKRCM